MISDSPNPSVPRIPGLRDSVPGAAYKKGDVIGQKYEVHGVLGAGGFGIVYLVYSHETKEAYALKTFQDKFLADAQTRERFRKEASVWVDLERHPYIVRAHLVDEIAGRLFIGLEYIAPDEQGLNSLDGYLLRRPPDLAQSLRWAIQFCFGMEYAYSKGVRCHRDIKPANIMVGSDKAVRITDFGLAGVLGMSRAVSGIKLNTQQGTVGLSGRTAEGTVLGTPEYMPPEQFTDAASCDERSDVYSFGIVLFQMAAGGALPFAAPARTFSAWHKVHSDAVRPVLQSPLSPIIARCLEREPGKRYQGFKELREVLEPLLRRQIGETVRLPRPSTLEAWEWTNKGISLGRLGRHAEAIQCHDKALKLDPRLAAAWGNKGTSLHFLCPGEEAIRCFDRALELDPRNVHAWTGKGNCLGSMGQCEKAVRCFDKALELDPRRVEAWYNKGIALGSLGQSDEAIRCFDEALELDPREARAWYNKGVILANLGRPEEAIACFDLALRLDPRDAEAWYNKGASLGSLGQDEEAIRCYDEALGLDPRLAVAWNNKGVSLGILGLHEEAIRCWDRALELDPSFALARYAKGLALEELGRRQDAVLTYRQFIALAPAQFAEDVADAQQRISELEGK